MRRFVLIPLLALAACGGQERATEPAAPAPTAVIVPAPKVTMAGQYATQLDRLADAVEAIDDDASAREAAKVIAEVNLELARLSKEAAAMNPAEAAVLVQAQQGEYVACQQRIATAMTRLAMENPAALGIVSKELRAMPKPG